MNGITIGSPYSQAARNAALASIGGDSFPQTTLELLQQAIIAIHANASGGGGGGSVAWGDITGTLTNQTDLVAAINAAKVPVIPRTIFVSSTGDDDTGDGTLNAPFLNIAQALATDTGIPRLIQISGGTFNIDLRSVSISSDVRFRGCGGLDPEGLGTFQTKLVIFGEPSPAFVTNQNGQDGANAILRMDDLYAVITSQGQDVAADDGATYTAGNGGNITVVGNCDVSIYNPGGSSESVANDSVVNGGNGGSITLSRGVKLDSAAGLLNSTGGTGDGGGANGADGALVASFCDIRGGTIDVGDVTLGNCAYTTGLTVTNDKGGNAQY